MIANNINMPRMFWDCNKKYFGNSLPTPYFGLMQDYKHLARFEYNRRPKGKAPISKQKILFSEYYDFDEEAFRNIMVHEMIHYYIAWNRIRTFWSHGKKFKKIANEMNEKYGLNVVIKFDASPFVIRSRH